MKNLIWVAALVVAAAGQALAQAAAQDPGVTSAYVLGDVVSVDASARRLTVKTEAGSVVNVTVPDIAPKKKVPMGESDLKKAADVTFDQIVVGDRVLANGRVSDDRKSALARVLVVNDKAEVEKYRAERTAWETSSVNGAVAAVNAAKKEFTVTLPDGKTTVVVNASGTAVRFRRYAADTVMFRDAVASSISELKVGDRVKARGTKSSDGKKLAADEVVSGSFVFGYGTVTDSDSSAKMFKVKLETSGEILTFTVAPRTRAMLYKQTPETAKALAETAERGVRPLLDAIPAVNISWVGPGSTVIVSGPSGAPGSSSLIEVYGNADALLAALEKPLGSRAAALEQIRYATGIGKP